MNSPAAKIVAGMAPQSLPDEMALALRQVDDLKCSWKRVTAYRSMAVRLDDYTREEREQADAAATSIELARRLQA